MCALICLLIWKWEKCVLCAVFGHVNKHLKLNVCNSFEKYWPTEHRIFCPNCSLRKNIQQQSSQKNAVLWLLCCFQDVHPGSVRTHQWFCLTALGRRWPLWWPGCPHRDVPFCQNWLKHKRWQCSTSKQWVGLVSSLVPVHSSASRESTFSVT